VATGSTNTLGACSASNGSGISTCTLASTTAEDKTLSITSPLAVIGDTVTFVAGRLHHLLLGPPSASVTAGESQRYIVLAQDQYHNNLGDVTMGTTFTIGPDGTCVGAVCAAASGGPHTVTGSHGVTTGTATLQVNYGFAGLLSPYAPPSDKAFKVASTILLKWQYTKSRSVAVPSPNAAPAVTIVPATCDGVDRTNEVVINGARNGGYLYTPATHTWQYDWKTTGAAAGCYNIRIGSKETGQTAGPFVIRLE